MKSLQNRTIVLLYCVLIILTFSKCKEEDQNEFGEVTVYIPMAAVYDGGITNNYPVPLDNNPAIQNYLFDDVSKTLSINLGVTQSGTQMLQAYSVAIITRPDTINKLIEDNIISDAVLLPNDVYTLPENISVPDAQQYANFLLTVDVQKLTTDYPDLAGKKLLLAVSLDSPSNYKLNNSLKTVIVIIDSEQFMTVTPPTSVNLLEGGDMEADSKQYWGWTNDTQVWGYTDDSPFEGKGGCLKWFDETTKGANAVIWTEIELEEGKQYELSAKVKIPEGALDCWLDVNLASISPDISGWDNTGTFMGIWIPEPTSEINGDIRNVGTGGDSDYGNGLANGGSNGVFTANSSTMYVWIKLGVGGDGTFNGPVLIDEVMIKEVE